MKHMKLRQGTEQWERVYLHCVYQTYAKIAKCSVKSDSRVTHIQTHTANSASWAAAQILVQLVFTLAGLLAVSPLHVSSKGYRLIWAVYTQNPGLILSVSLLSRILPSISSCYSCPELHPGSSVQKDDRFSIGVLDSTVVCSQEKNWK